MAIRINLVPSEILARAAQKQHVFQAAVVGVILAIFLVIASSAHYFTLARLESVLAYDEGELKKLEVIVAKVEELERTAAAVRSRLGVITDLLKGRPLYAYFMSDLVRTVPLGVRIHALQTQGGGSGAAPLKLSMTADARTNEDIAAWVRQMESAGKFSGIEMGPVTSIGDEGGYNFTLKATYTPQL